MLYKRFVFKSYKMRHEITLRDWKKGSGEIIRTKRQSLKFHSGQHLKLEFAALGANASL